MKIVALVGASGSGKTTLICELIAQYVSEGRRVAAIKHTHHPLNFEHRGDTARFRAAGAEVVILAGEREAIVQQRVVEYGDPRELLAYADGAEIVLIEGFKQYGGWPRVEVTGETSPREVRRMIDP